MSSQPTLQTVERALTFLEHIAAAPKPQTVQDVSAALNLNITTCYHLMRTLLARGYLERRDDATLTLGRQVGVLFGAFQQSLDMDQSLAALVHQLAKATSETSFLSVLDETKVMIRVLAEGSQPLRVSGLYVGLTGNEHRRSSGKAILAHVGDAQRNAILSRSLSGLSREKREALLGDLMPDLDRTRQRGWSLDGGRTETGISSVGAPVFNAAGQVYGAIGVVTPSFRMDRSQAEFVEAVTDVAQRATALLQGIHTLDTAGQADIRPRRGRTS